MPEFADPAAFLLLAIPVLIYLAAPAAARSRAVLIVPEGVGRHILAGAEGVKGMPWRSMALPGLVWVLLVIALAGPRQLAPNVALPMTGRDLILAFDLSGSMVRDDFSLDGKPITRFDALKRVGERFARDRAGDRLGLIVFGSEAYAAAAPTFDTGAVADTIRDLVIGISGRATNISDALGLALKRLEASDAQTKVVILLSDGTNNAGSAIPRDVARLAREMGVRVHTIAMAPKTLAEAPEERGVVDAATLQAVADISGGKMFRGKTLDDLEAVAADLDRLEPTARAGLAAETYRELWIWPALLAGLLGLWLGWRRG
ncbi:VWA domain-containing protein [Oceaniglobus roseus]|uniref:VWA domain-containing protein n=1 Tax=Oceaniglobus roseus TaxID=1737570 RepID=UPI000C7F4B7B|nr:VWA domain-containing protein [Kandeliimicrobium roseum]